MKKITILPPLCHEKILLNMMRDRNIIWKNTFSFTKGIIRMEKIFYDKKNVMVKGKLFRLYHIK